MKTTITIREALEAEEVRRFWEQLRIYFARDLFPEPESEDLEYFLGEEYSSHMARIHDRATDRCHWLLFCRDGLEIGFALPVIYDSEDGKGFLMEFCVYPEFRGRGLGSACAEALLDWCRARGATYFELNCDREDRKRFWSRLGFRENGADEWGVPLMVLPPEERLPITLEVLRDPEDWQLKKLMNGYKIAIGEETLTEEAQGRLTDAIQQGKITFLLAKRGTRAVGMCSVSRVWSSFCCGDTAVFEDFFVEPVFRNRGAARLLAEGAREWCAGEGITSLTVCCAPCDEGMYRSLGFEVPLGRTFACIME